MRSTAVVGELLLYPSNTKPRHNMPAFPYRETLFKFSKKPYTNHCFQPIQTTYYDKTKAVLIV